MMPRYNIDMARTLHGYRKDTDSTHKKWSDMIRHNRSVILKYPAILALDMTWIQSHVYGIKCQGTGLQTRIGFIAKKIMKKLHYMAPLKDLSRTDEKWVDVLEDYSLVLVVEPIWNVPISESPINWETVNVLAGRMLCWADPGATKVQMQVHKICTNISSTKSCSKIQWEW